MIGRTAIGALAALLLPGLSGCGEHTDPLGRGYSYIGQDGQNSAIVDANGEYAVCADVDRIALEGEMVAGFRQRPGGGYDVDAPPCTSQSYGYFLFDMRRGKLVGGLDEAALEQTAGAAGLKPGIAARMAAGRGFR